MVAPRFFRAGIPLVAALVGTLTLAAEPRRIQNPPDTDGREFIYHGVTIGKLATTDKSGKNPFQNEIEAYFGATKRRSVAWVDFTQVVTYDNAVMVAKAVAQPKPDAKQVVFRNRYRQGAVVKVAQPKPDAKQVVFPATECGIVSGYRAVPFVTLVTPGPASLLKDPKVAPNAWELDGNWKTYFSEWGKAAKAYCIPDSGPQQPLIICWGAGANGSASCWTNKGDAAKFVFVYRAIQDAIMDQIDLRRQGNSVTWVFQIQLPDAASVQFEDYYPGDKLHTIDWIGVSVNADTTSVGSGQSDTSGDSGDGTAAPDAKNAPKTFTPLAAQFGPYYTRIRELTLVQGNPKDPRIITELGCPHTDDSASLVWVRDALHTIVEDQERFRKVIGFSWANSSTPTVYCTDCQSSKGSGVVSLKLEDKSEQPVACVFRKYLDRRNVYSWPTLVKD